LQQAKSHPASSLARVAAKRFSSVISVPKQGFHPINQILTGVL
jgi:hypothetical protein